MKKSENCRGIIILILVLLISVFVGSLLVHTEKVSNCVEVDIEQCALYGYSCSGNMYLNEIGDAHIQLPELNQYVAGVSINFTQPLEQLLNITIYYADRNHGYDERYTSSVDVLVGATRANLLIAKNVTTCRIDIGTHAGEHFEINDIIINDPATTGISLFKHLITILVIIFLLVTAYVFYNRERSLQKIFAGLALGIGLFYLVTITPLSVPDEPHHYHSSYQLSNYLLFHWDTLEYGDAQDFDYAQLMGHQNTSSGYLRIINELGGEASEGESVLIPKPRALSYFIEYLPQALGIMLARILNLNFITKFLIGRLFNLFFYSVCLYFAVKRIPKFKLVLGLIGIMPMSLHQAASYSYDAFINGMAFVLIASILKAVYEENRLDRKDYLWVLISGVLLAPAKVIYSAILLLCFLIPQARFKNKQQKLQRIALILTIAAVFVVLFQRNGLASMTTGVDGLNWEGQHNYTLSFVFQHPLRTAEIFLQTFIELWENWFYWMIGSSLSGFTLPVPTWIINVFILIIFLAMLSQLRTTESLPSVHRYCYLCVFVAVLLLAMTYMFLSWTSDTREIIQGVQGRYLIPVFPLLMFALSNKTLVLRRNIDKELIIVSMFLHGNVIINILNYTLQR